MTWTRGGAAGAAVLAALAVLLTASSAPGAEAARILVVISMPAPSHHIVFTAVTRKLADSGHHITLVTPLEKADKLLPTKNHLIVSVTDPSADEFKRQAVRKMMTGEQGSVFVAMWTFFSWGPKMVRGTLDHPAYRAEVNKPGQKYDLIITEAFFLQEAFLALGHKFNAPVIALNPFGTTPTMNYILGGPSNPAWVPPPQLGFSDRMTFVERTINTLYYTFSNLMFYFHLLPNQQAVADEYFPGAPPLKELFNTKVALTIVNNHHTLSHPTPLGPNVLQVGGIHIEYEPKPLPKDLKDFMDGAKDGVVYFSMGSNLLMEFLPRDKMLAFFNALGSVKQNVLLKWDGPTPETVAPNIRLIKWAPQADILAHPNLRVFVTHGGLLSTQEAVFHGVPVVGIPVFADQSFNMGLATQKGFCQQVSYADLSEKDFSAALKEILENPKYKEAAMRLSRLFRSKPMRPADQAVFWVEHVLEHGGDHLRPAAVHLQLHQLLLLDVLAALAAPLLLCWLACAACCRRCRRTSDAAADKNNKKKKN